MKNIIKKISLTSTLLLSTLALSSCAMYNAVGQIDSAIDVYANNDNCFLGEIHLTDTTKVDYEIPSTYDGKNITQLGGKCNMVREVAFTVSINSSIELFETTTPYHVVTSTSRKMFKEMATVNDYIVHNIVFNITLPTTLKKVFKVEDTPVHLETIGDENTAEIEYHAYLVYYNFTIDTENKYFYTENGKLYNKDDNTIVSGFEYLEQ